MLPKNFLAAISFKFQQIIVSLNRYRRQNPLKLELGGEEKNDTLFLKLIYKRAEELQEQTLAIPIPYQDELGNLLVGRRVMRAVGTWHFKGKEYSYWQLLAWLLTDRIEEAFPEASKRSQLERLVQSFEQGMAPLTFRSVQTLVDSIVNKLPLAGTPYEAWAMCQRVVFLDQVEKKDRDTGKIYFQPFDSLPPKAALKYQKEQNKKFFPWTSLGLSDSSMVKNYLLKADLRKYTPFGIRSHNPMRNLYQTLGMRGDELPLIMTESAARLALKGVERTGWNWMTCFLDVPANFEDQLLVDVRHLDKFTFNTLRLICYGEVKVALGDDITEGGVISVEPNGEEMRFWSKCDRANIVDIQRETVNFNGKIKEITAVYVEAKHYFKEGIKLTNCHGNKGVVSFVNCGSMLDTGRKQEVPIDIIVSARTIKKRRNYGQVLEVLTTLLRGKEKRIVIKDDFTAALEGLKRALARQNYAEDGTSPVKTPWGEFQAVCGWGFWGLIKNPEGQVWSKAEVVAEDMWERRQAGVKISHIELKGLTTIFGQDNPVIKEILSHQQGLEDVYQFIDILEGMRGKSKNMPIRSWEAIKPLLQTGSYFHQKRELVGTVADEALLPDGFALELPRIYHIFIPSNSKSSLEGVEEMLLPAECKVEDVGNYAKDGGKNIFLNKILVPAAKLRAPWQHSTGLWGISDLGGYLNNIVLTSQRVVRKESDEASLLLAVKRYFHSISQRLSTKTGEISTYALAVRYPHSVKGTATLDTTGELPANWLEIHEDMAKDLGVVDGDHVIAERFPCLGFKSLRIQRIKTSKDPQCRYVIRVSGNSLVSQNLDFDGDVLFLMSFRTKEANEALAADFAKPDALRQKFIDEANNKKQPILGALTIDEMGLTIFPDLTPERQAEIVGDLTGVKRGTGSIVALAYNLMRIIEGNMEGEEKSVEVGLEVILDKVANSVFSQKHAGESLEERCKEAICRANLKEMLGMGFPEDSSKRLCEIIRKEAGLLGVKNLDSHFFRHKKYGSSNIINVIVRERHRFYFATRANLHPVRLLEHLEAPAADLVSKLWHEGREKSRALKEGEINT